MRILSRNFYTVFIAVITLLFVNSNSSFSADLEFAKYPTDVTDSPVKFDVPIKATFKNNTDKEIKLLCKMTVNYLAGEDGVDDFGMFLGHSATFCWGDIYDPINPGTCYAATRNKLVSDFTITIPAHSESNPAWFTGYLYPAKVVGKSSLTYTIYNSADENQSASFTVNFNITNATSVDTEVLPVVNLFPNPTNQELNLTIATQDLPSSIRVVDVNGVVEFEKSINSQFDLQFDTSMLTSGKYFIQFVGGKLDKTSVPFVVTK